MALLNQLGTIKKNEMKHQFQLLISGFILTLSFSSISGQEAWLSTPESINQFRQQVEHIKPDSAKSVTLYQDYCIYQ